VKFIVILLCLLFETRIPQTFSRKFTARRRRSKSRAFFILHSAFIILHSSFIFHPSALV